MNQDQRLRYALASGEDGVRRRVPLSVATAKLAEVLSRADAKDVALLVTPQYTCEEYDALFGYFVKKLGVKQVFQWREPVESLNEFDGILYRGDHNPNTRGLSEALKKVGLPGDVKHGFDDLAKSGAKIVIALAPEIGFQYPSLAQQLARLSELAFVSLWTILGTAATHKGLKQLLPMKGFAEKRGTFLNHQGKSGELMHPFPAAADEARDVAETVAALAEVMAHTV